VRIATWSATHGRRRLSGRERGRQRSASSATGYHATSRSLLGTPATAITITITFTRTTSSRCEAASLPSRARTSTRPLLALGGTDGGGDFIQEREEFRQFVGIDPETARAENDLRPPTGVRLGDSRLLNLHYVTPPGLVGYTEHLHHPAIEPDHDRAENEFVHPSIMPGLRGESRPPGRRHEAAPGCRVRARPPGGVLLAVLQDQRVLRAARAAGFDGPDDARARAGDGAPCRAVPVQCERLRLRRLADTDWSAPRAWSRHSNYQRTLRERDVDDVA